MNVELRNYDIYPKVFRTGETVEITIRPLGLHAQLPEEVRLCV